MQQAAQRGAAACFPYERFPGQLTQQARNHMRVRSSTQRVSGAKQSPTCRRSTRSSPTPHAGALAAVAPKADAIELPFHDSIGGGGKRGSLPPSGTTASMGSYNMEGIKKQGVKPDQKRKVLDELKAEAAKGK